MYTHVNFTLVNKKDFYDFARPFPCYPYFICEWKFYARTHLKITRQRKSTLTESVPREDATSTSSTLRALIKKLHRNNVAQKLGQYQECLVYVVTLRLVSHVSEIYPSVQRRTLCAGLKAVRLREIRQCIIYRFSQG